MFVLTWVFVLFTFTHALERFVPLHQEWHLSCRADSYFDPPQTQAASSVVSELLLTFTLENQHAVLRYHLGNELSSAESIVLQGDVVKVDFYALNYELQMRLKNKKINDDSILLGYLLNELTVSETQLINGETLPLEVQLNSINDDQSRATLTFIPSNSIWSCEIIPAVLPQPH
ncbi:hypothetical protein [Shewanella saliphila]|uniref:Uncharacterized protein n=1 Tax=Shewanella saliphila TaxID=2282698 RepID=A0ABQ2Q3F1_9GAMM|nr:hypothetical protein [Shewanella saliphila]MCL1101089.1 hypothetical protein [Shewanella saliphila]GGP45759.1 hypothetical protein GCM10009409_10530 [Shewanella saliphila]